MKISSNLIYIALIGIVLILVSDFYSHEQTYLSNQPVNIKAEPVTKAKRFKPITPLANILPEVMPTPKGQLSNNCNVTVTLAWDPVNDPRVVGYQLYVGPTVSHYTNNFYFQGTSGSVPKLCTGSTYHFAVTSIDNTGLESNFSSDVSYTVPAVTNLMTNVVLVSVSILTSHSLSSWTTNPSVFSLLITNPVSPTYYRTLMNIATTNIANKVVKLDSSTLVFTNK